MRHQRSLKSAVRHNGVPTWRISLRLTTLTIKVITCRQRKGATSRALRFERVWDGTLRASRTADRRRQLNGWVSAEPMMLRDDARRRRIPR